MFHNEEDLLLKGGPSRKVQVCRTVDGLQTSQKNFIFFPKLRIFLQVLENLLLNQLYWILFWHMHLNNIIKGDFLKTRGGTTLFTSPQSYEGGLALLSSSTKVLKDCSSPKLRKVIASITAFILLYHYLNFFHLASPIRPRCISFASLLPINNKKGHSVFQS